MDRQGALISAPRGTGVAAVSHGRVAYSDWLRGFGLITIVDLFGAAKIVNARNFVPFESFIAAGLFYLGLTFLIVWGFFTS